VAWKNTKTHIPVLKNAVISYLSVVPDGTYLDGTVGLGGHSFAIQNLLSQNGKLIGLDGDEEAVKFSKQRLSPSYHLFQGSYDTFPIFLPSIGVQSFDGMFLDLGMSSFQLDTPQRGFSHRKDGPLDMRFNINNSISAHQIVNDWSFEELKRIFRKYGGEFRAASISLAIINARKEGSIESTLNLSEIIKSAIGKQNLIKTRSRIFQAIRIAVNDELKTLNNFLEIFNGYLNKGGRLVIISYHSLEDRLVKQAFRELEKKCVCPPELPLCQCNHKPSLKVLTKRVIRPSKLEINDNSRARSAKLRAAEKI
jgi:16S rRNA (cytosine1402-N4)-methyltransferase